MQCNEMKNFYKAGEFSRSEHECYFSATRRTCSYCGHERHDEDEYSYIFSGEIETYSNGEYSVEKAGDATLIPAGEEHWCVNNSNEPCMLVCFMVKKS